MTDATDRRVRYSLGVLLGEKGEVHEWPSWLRYEQPDRKRPWNALTIVPSGFFDGGYGRADALPAPPLAEVEGTPLLFGRPAVERRGTCLVVHADILASAYVLLTRYEEWVRREVRDPHGRFPGRESLPYRAGFIDRPVVDEYGDLLRAWARAVGADVPEPQGEFSVWLTHDIDTLGVRRGAHSAVRSLASGILGSAPLSQALRDAAAAVSVRRHPFDNVSEVLSLDRLLLDGTDPDRCRSTFFFMAGGRNPHDSGNYLGNPIGTRAVMEVLRAGAEIGLHVSYDAGASPHLARGELAALEAAVGVPVRTGRHHFLAWREPEHGHVLSSAGIRRDSTMGYADVAGFRLGTCRPVGLFDPAAMRPIDIEEHPLIVMDVTLSRAEYMDLSQTEAFRFVKSLAQRTRQHRGEFVILWHNNVLARSSGGWHRPFYSDLLAYLRRLLSGGA